MNEAYIFFTVIYSVVIVAILALFARDLVKWLKRRRTPHAPDGAICPRCNRSVSSAGHRYACILHGTPRR